MVFSGGYTSPWKLRISVFMIVFIGAYFLLQTVSFPPTSLAPSVEGEEIDDATLSPIINRLTIVISAVTAFMLAGFSGWFIAYRRENRIRSAQHSFLNDGPAVVLMSK